MRDGANRALWAAVAASLLLHAGLLLSLPMLRELAAELPKAPARLVARLVEAAPQAQPEKPAAPPPEPERRPAEPRRVAKPLPTPAPAVEPPALPAQPVVSEAPPAPAAPVAPAAPGPVARLEPQPMVVAPVGPDPGALERYRLQIVTAAARFKRYPRVAIDNSWEGEVVVRMTIGADGRIAALGIKKSSGYEVLDRQALEMFRTAKPFVMLPPDLAGKEFELELRAIYGLRDQGSG